MLDSYYEGAKDALQLMVAGEATVTTNGVSFTVALTKEAYRHPIELFSWRYEDNNEDNTPIPEPELDWKTQLKIKHGLLPAPEEPDCKTEAEKKYCEANNWVREKSGMSLEEAVAFISEYRKILHHGPVG